MTCLAVIDLGTNSARSIVVEVRDGEFREVGGEREYLLLGKRVRDDGSFGPKTLRRTVTALDRIAEAAREQGASEIRVVATEVVRHAPNAAELVERVRDELGLALEVLTAEEEGRLAWLSASHAFDLSHGPAAVFDLGGGSLEIALARDGIVHAVDSAPLGATVLTRRFVRHDPLREEELSAMRSHIRIDLSEMLAPDDHGAFPAVIGSGGTVRAIAAMTHAREGRKGATVHGSRVSRQNVLALLGDLAGATAAERRRTPGMSRRRTGIIVAGALVVAEVLSALGSETLVASEDSIREGAVIDALERLAQGI